MSRRIISQDELDGFEIDDVGQLYWKGKSVVLEQRLTLKGWELLIAGMAALGATAAGLHPFLKSFGWIA